MSSKAGWLDKRIADSGTNTVNEIPFMSFESLILAFDFAFIITSAVALN
jgi:hypothetical protein